MVDLGIDVELLLNIQEKQEIKDLNEKANTIGTYNNDYDIAYLINLTIYYFWLQEYPIILQN